jgi:hypothetical protein
MMEESLICSPLLSICAGTPIFPVLLVLRALELNWRLNHWLPGSQVFKLLHHLSQVSSSQTAHGGASQDPADVYLPASAFLENLTNALEIAITVHKGYNVSYFVFLSSNFIITYKSFKFYLG